ncbi:hypothetical protein FHW96_002365 [Novosphingobium sp. SG751A]|uniref:hypothetical protein n=1 Tax=Novosphingobium sp. SG751A TaxID=2587000 RepID=UPI001552EFEB|nr:hypothetical protein [Novosphingobium sp. SG751A]NOW46207.1 hypothetical protein [Novosphingobium sp. SG751A]
MSNFQTTRRATTLRYSRIGHLRDMLHRWEMEAAMAGISGEISFERANALLARIDAQTARLAKMGSAGR